MRDLERDEAEHLTREDLTAMFDHGRPALLVRPAPVQARVEFTFASDLEGFQPPSVTSTSSIGAGTQEAVAA